MLRSNIIILSLLALLVTFGVGSSILFQKARERRFISENRKESLYNIFISLRKKGQNTREVTVLWFENSSLQSPVKSVLSDTGNVTTYTGSHDENNSYSWSIKCKGTIRSDLVKSMYLHLKNEEEITSIVLADQVISGVTFSNPHTPIITCENANMPNIAKEIFIEVRNVSANTNQN